MTLAPFLKYAPPRLRQFFAGGPPLTFESPLSEQELSDRFRATLQDGWNLPTGATGKLVGSRLYVKWGTGWQRSGSLAFRGRIEPSATGSRVTGRVSASGFEKVLIGLWCAAILLFSIALVWTIIIPLAGYALLWSADGLLWLDDTLHPGRSQKIADYIRETCTASPR